MVGMKRNRKIKLQIELLEKLTQKRVLLTEKLAIEFRKEVINFYWKHVRQTTINLIYTDLLNSGKTERIKKIVNSFFEGMKDEYLGEEHEVKKDFKIPLKGLIIRNENMKLEKSIKVKVVVSLDINDQGVSGGYSEMQGELLILPYMDLNRDALIALMLEDKRTEFNKAINDIYPILYHELIHAVKENSSLRSDESDNYSVDFTQKKYYLSRSEFETQLYSTYHTIKKNIIRNKEKLYYSVFFKSAANIFPFLTFLKKYDKERYHEAMNELFDLLKDNYLQKHGYEVPDWINE